MTSIYLAVCLSLPAAAYARPEMLVEPADLMKSKRPRILDARPRKEYDAGHIPGAVWVDAAGWSKAFAAGAARASWVKRIGALGITADTPVVVYGDTRSSEFGRVWWLLRYWGIRDVRLLNGGWRGWLAAGGKREKAAHTPRAVEPKLTAHPERLATRGQIVEGLEERRAGQVIDARSTAEFCGEKKLAKRGGAIPQAKHLDWTDTLDARTGRFRSAAELAKLFREAGIDPARPATTYCQSGGRAAVMAFVLELLSGKPARNYYGSWREWGNAPDTPIVTPKKGK